MEEQITYSTLLFQNKALAEKEKKEDITSNPGEKPEEHVSAAPKPNEELTIYSEVKQKDAVTAGPKKTDHLDTKPEGRTKEPVATVPKVPAAVNSCITVFLVCLGILFLMLVGVVVVLLVNITMAMNKQEATINQQNSSINNLTAENQHLILENRNLTNQTEQLLVENRNLTNQTEQLLVENRNLTNQTEQLLVENRNLTNQTEQLLVEKENLTKGNEQLMKKTQILENQTAELSREKDILNWTLEVILTFDNFPVKDLCPNKKCKPCLEGWRLFKDRCYLFHNKSAPWNTWEQSRQLCQNQRADLVVIDSLEEQEFISNHSSYYFDVYHGYWLGLRQVNNNWTWINGRIDTLKYWIKEDFSSSHPFTLLIPGRNYRENWISADTVFQNRFICERKPWS